jgi:hypothetical protein
MRDSGLRRRFLLVKRIAVRADLCGRPLRRCTGRQVQVKDSASICWRESAGYFATVLNATAWLPPRCHHEWMPHKKSKNELRNATRADVRKEMAKPRIARSARIAELNLDTTRIIEQPSTTMPGTVKKIIPSPRTNLPEKAQIAVAGAPGPYRDLRIESTLTDEHGDDVKLKKGAHVEITVTANDDRRRN